MLGLGKEDDGRGGEVLVSMTAATLACRAPMEGLRFEVGSSPRGEKAEGGGGVAAVGTMEARLIAKEGSSKGSGVDDLPP